MVVHRLVLRDLGTQGSFTPYGILEPLLATIESPYLSAELPDCLAKEMAEMGKLLPNYSLRTRSVAHNSFSVNLFVTVRSVPGGTFKWLQNCFLAY